MRSTILNMSPGLNKRRVLGVLAGRDMPVEQVVAWARSADYVLAADGAANFLAEGDFIPDVVIGDFDSISRNTKDVQKMLVHIEDQNRSDCDKLLDYAQSLGFETITLCAMEGDAIDHIIGSLQSAARSTLEVRVATRRGVIMLLKGAVSASFDVPTKTRVSLLPISNCSGVELTGVEWSLFGTEMSPIGFTSLSNRSVENVSVSIDSGVAALFLSHPSLELPHWPS